MLKTLNDVFLRLMAIGLALFLMTTLEEMADEIYLMNKLAKEATKLEAAE